MLCVREASGALRDPGSAWSDSKLHLVAEHGLNVLTDADVSAVGNGHELMIGEERTVCADKVEQR